VDARDQDSDVRHAEVRAEMGRASNATDWMMRTFLDTLERSTVDCRELKGTNWAGRSPLLGSIVKCRPSPESRVVLLAKVARP
jgi:hypothetical protein